MAAGGALTGDRLDAAIAALRGESTPTSQPASTSAPSAPSAQNQPPAALIAREEASAKTRRVELDRREREIQDQWAMLQSAQIELLRRQEALAAERAAWEESLKRQAEELALSGAAKELEYLESIKPQLAKELLHQKSDADVVQLFLQMDARTGRKIMESCKTQEERLWIGRILEQLRQRNDRQAEDLTAGSP
ncbi:MAG: hypothetical protein HUU22_13640 [Phycisphaerae bacterium]|nr:hypothetical protein [Phycisphaerae bacterium]NUQ47063.1 hypothetical protein [Phycisphaerae bacterium]